jgi:hypothetical protein
MAMVLSCGWAAGCGDADPPVARPTDPVQGGQAAPGKGDDPLDDGSGQVPVRAIQNVFVIVMENHAWSQIKGSPSARYINDVLLPMASHAEAYFNPPGNHPSEPNYIWLEAGSNLGITSDDDPDRNSRDAPHLSRLLDSAGVSWRSYQEDIDGRSCPVRSDGLYGAKHNPFVFFEDVTLGNDPGSAPCIAHVRPYSELAGDLQSGNVARYNFITPNLCNDMHGVVGFECPPFFSDLVKRGDEWLSREVPRIMASPVYQQGGAIFITWDESEGGDQPIGMIVLSPLARGNGYSNTIPYTHSSTLRTMQEILGVGPYLGDAANATSLSDLFDVYP